LSCNSRKEKTIDIACRIAGLAPVTNLKADTKRATVPRRGFGADLEGDGVPAVRFT
jgi:hypothetical protein